MNRAVEAIALAPATCRDCPRLAGIAEGLRGLPALDGAVDADDIADLATMACGRCAAKRAGVDVRPDTLTFGGAEVTHVWLRLFPRAGGDPVTVVLLRATTV